MAARSGASVGTLVTITILSLLSLGLFVATIVFYGKFSRTQSEKQMAEQALREFVRQEEQQDPQIVSMAQLAGRSGQSVVGYLQSSHRQTMERLSGSGRDTYEAMMERLGNVRLAGVAAATGWTPAQQGAQPPSLQDLVAGSNMLQLLRDVDAHATRLASNLADAERARVVAENDLRNETERVAAIQSRHQATLAAIEEQLDRYRDELNSYRAGTDRARADMDARVERIRGDSRDREGQLLDRISALEDERARLQNQLDVLRGERTKDLFRVTDEYALVDGQIVGTNATERQVTISVGRRNKVPLGMSFSVYSSASAIRPDPETGDYPRGKASIEVIRVDETTSLCRVLFEVQGNPIVRGDVIANPVYDPNKVYKMVVAGNFDANNDGVATEAEQAAIRAKIEAWGGMVIDDLSGDVDFLVLGQAPVLPPAPGPQAPIAVVLQYTELQAALRRYEQLFAQATATSIPVLNENRLRTLLGER